jgi:hypothetical protein
MCEIVAPQGNAYRNLCIGCDRFHQQVLGPVIAELRAERLPGKSKHPSAALPLSFTPPSTSP